MVMKTMPNIGDWSLVRLMIQKTALMMRNVIPIAFIVTPLFVGFDATCGCGILRFDLEKVSCCIRGLTSVEFKLALRKLL